MAKDIDTINRDIDYCERCRCQFCTEYCASYQVTKRLPWSARGRLDIARYLRDGEMEFDEQVRDAVYTCQLCKRCYEHCSAVLPDHKRIDVAEMMVFFRNEIVTKHPGLEPDVFRDMCENMKTCGAIVATSAKEKAAWAKDLGLLEGGERIFYASCMNPLMGYFEMALKTSEKIGMSMKGLIKAEKGIRKLKLDKVLRGIANSALHSNDIYLETLRNSVKILQKLDINVGYLSDEPCCGAALHTYGHLGDFKEHAKKTFQALKEKGIREVIMINPICQGIMATVYPNFVDGWDIQCLSFLDIVAEKVKQQEIRLALGEELTVTYHDPCYGTRYLDQVTASREILKNIENLNFVEPEYHGKKTNCCGGGGPEVKYSELSMTMAKNRAVELLETGADKIITACPVCVVMLRLGVKEAGKKAEVLDLSDLICRAL